MKDRILPMAGMLTDEKAAEQAEMFANRLYKTWQRLAPPFKKQGIGAFRLFDRDIPEIRAVVDAYVSVEGELHLFLTEHERRQTALVADWLGGLGAAAARRFEIPAANIHYRRRSQLGVDRYDGRSTPRGREFLVHEGGLKFWVNLDDYPESGLLAEHRLTRARIREEIRGLRLLHLYGYTGALTVYAAAGGARATVTVDGSERYLDWTTRNLETNGLAGPAHRLVQSEVRAFIQRHATETFDHIFCDPPSHSVRADAPEFDVQRDHSTLLRRLSTMLTPTGVLWFTTNLPTFHPSFIDLPFADIQPLDTVPEEFRNRQIHRLWRMQR